MQRPWKANLSQKAGLFVVLSFTVAALYGVMRCSTTDDFCSLQKRGSNSFSRKIIVPDKAGAVDRNKCIEVTGTKQVGACLPIIHHLAISRHAFGARAECHTCIGLPACSCLIYLTSPTSLLCLKSSITMLCDDLFQKIIVLLASVNSFGGHCL